MAQLTSSKTEKDKLKEILEQTKILLEKIEDWGDDSTYLAKISLFAMEDNWNNSQNDVWDNV